MNGSGMPFVGSKPSTTLRLISAWPTIIVVMPMRQISAEIVGGFHGGDKSAPAINRKKREHDDRADKAQLFADDREDKIRVRLGQEEKFLAAFHQADAGKAARTNGDERLQQLEAAACGSSSGERTSRRAQAVRHADDGQINGGNGGQQRAADIL